ncbi:MAG: T9SS type A sorting domain-containing protein [Flavobacteriales bacterium]|nr:T9SS type A sorting domain-containing protein [Flavobacteriales bacterium]
MFNALGEKVMTSSFTGTATTLNLAGNAAGMYTVRIGDGTNFNMQRVVLK